MSATSTWPAMIEYLVGVALSVDPAGDADTPPEVLQRVSQLVSDIFEADQLRIVTDFIDNARLRIVDETEAARIFIGYSCEALNDYYTRQETGLEGPKPCLELPQEAL